MAFSDEVIRPAWTRSGGKCECARSTHWHFGSCYRVLDRESRGKETEYGWEAHHINSNGDDTLSNCEILCQNCHKQTQSYGVS